jgi:hypothetical protein
MTEPRSDPQRLRRLLGLHAVREPRIIDTTYGHGVFWRGLPYRPTRLDVRDLPGVDHVAAWSDLPQLFGPASFDVVVWDPIHVSDIGASSVMGQRYAADAAPVRGPDINALYEPFLESARQVLAPESGICIVKLADQVHGQRQRLHFVDLVIVARALNWTVCDYDVAVRPSTIVDSKWIRELHVRKSWAFWVVLRNGPRCEGPGRMRMHICPGCQEPFRPKQRNAVTCGERCKKRLYRGKLSPTEKHRAERSRGHLGVAK